jgi:ribosome-binding protein aMBF1 (putative translation factor)
MVQVILTVCNISVTCMIKGRGYEMSILDTSRHKRRLDERMLDPEFRREYEAARRQIDQIDAVVRALDRLRIEAGMPKAELARRIGKNPSAIRRLFSAETNPELGTVAAIAAALDAEIRIIPNKPSRESRRPRSSREAAPVS